MLIMGRLSVRRRGMVGQSKTAPAAQWVQFKKHSSQLHRWCSRAVVFFTRCQESKPANPLRLEVVCMFPSKFLWGLLCYLAHASHPAELKCSQLKVCWRQQLCCSKLEKAGKREGLEGKSTLVLSEMIHITARHPPRSSHFLLITIVIRKHQANSTNECLINTPSCSRGRQATCSWLILSLLLLSVFLLPPSHSLKTEENKGRDRRKAI